MRYYYSKLLLTATGLILGANTLRAQWVPVTKMPGGPTDGCVNFVIGDTAYVSGGTQGMAFNKYYAKGDKWTSSSYLGGNGKRAFGFSFAVNGKGYVMGGFNTAGCTQDMWMYDPATGQWTQKKDFPGGLRNAGFNFVINNVAYVGGGEQGSNGRWDDFWKYDDVNDQWTQLPNLPMGPIEFPTCFVVNGKAYVTTWEGTDGTSVFEEKTMWEYNPANGGNWTKKADFPGTARQCATAFALGKYGFVGGGQTDYNTVYKDMWRYDVTTDTWTQVEDFPMSTSAWSTAFVVNGTAYLGTGVAFVTAGLTGTDAFYKYKSSLDVANIQPAASALSIYPNPASRAISIDAARGKAAQIVIYDVTGRLVMNVPNTMDRKFDISTLDKGMYILEVNDGITNSTGHFIKQ